METHADLLCSNNDDMDFESFSASRHMFVSHACALSVEPSPEKLFVLSYANPFPDRAATWRQPQGACPPSMLACLIKLGCLPKEVLVLIVSGCVTLLLAAVLLLLRAMSEDSPWLAMCCLLGLVALTLCYLSRKNVIMPGPERPGKVNSQTVMERRMVSRRIDGDEPSLQEDVISADDIVLVAPGDTQQPAADSHVRFVSPLPNAVDTQNMNTVRVDDGGGRPQVPAVPDVVMMCSTCKTHRYGSDAPQTIPP